MWKTRAKIWKPMNIVLLGSEPLLVSPPNWTFSKWRKKFPFAAEARKHWGISIRSPNWRQTVQFDLFRTKWKLFWGRNVSSFETSKTRLASQKRGDRLIFCSDTNFLRVLFLYLYPGKCRTGLPVLSPGTFLKVSRHILLRVQFVGSELIGVFEGCDVCGEWLGSNEGGNEGFDVIGKIKGSEEFGDWKQSTFLCSLRTFDSKFKALCALSGATESCLITTPL